MMVHDRIGEYLDGELAPDVEAAVLDHIAVCAECQTALHAEVQLRDREDALRGGVAVASDESRCRPGEYLAGLLEGNAELAFLDHLAACASCQQGLHDEVQLRDREDVLRAAQPAYEGPREAHGPPHGRESSTTEDGPGRWPLRRIVHWAAGPTAAAAALVVFLYRPTPPPMLALRPERTIEIRMSHSAAARYRPYNPRRDAENQNEAIAPTSIADFDRAGDCQGVATAYVLAEEWKLAESQYSRCKAGTGHATSADLYADRAGFAVLRGKFEDALELSEQALDASPDHAVALWNRALALKGLGLDLSAAAAFDRVAVLDLWREPAWAHEAAERAVTLRTEIEGIRTAYDDVVRLGAMMVDGKQPLDPTLARRVPGRSRLFLHDAIRTATSIARLDELAPLVKEVERRAGAGLAHHLELARAQLSPERVAASAGYQALIAHPSKVDDRTWDSWLAGATRAGADDLILGARIATERLDGERPAEQLARASGDPWFELSVELARVRLALKAGKIETATALLAALQKRCPADATSFRCMQLAVEQSKLALDRHRPADAKSFALAALAMSRALGEWDPRGQALTFAADAERFAGAFAPAAAYYEEARRSLKPCGAHNTAFTVAEMLFHQHRFEQARAQVLGAPACNQVPAAVELTTLARLYRVGYPVADRAELTAKIAASRSAPTFARDAPYFDYLADWVKLDDDSAARSRLARAADLAGGIEGSMREKTIAAVNNALFADAGKRSAWAEALQVVARAHDVPVPQRCALALGADDFRFTVIALGPDGELAGHYDPNAAQPTEWLAPEPMRRQLAGCDEVAVLALPPWLGIGPVMDDETPWHYVLGPATSPETVRARRVVVSTPATPPEAGLAPLPQRTWPELTERDELITGRAATPDHVLAAISDATVVEIHSHATWLHRYDAPVLALAPGANGWALAAAQIRSTRLKGAPVVVLAACGVGAAAKFEHQAWGLPLAFRAAGASAVIAPLVAIPDQDAMAFFQAVVAEISDGARPAVAVAHVRSRQMRGQATSWMRYVIVFQ